MGHRSKYRLIYICPNKFISTKKLRAGACLAALLTVSACTSTAQQANDQLPQASKILLMGEVHDNPEGHRHRFEDLQKLVVAGWRPAIAMEQFDRENQAQLNQAQAECKDADCIISKQANKRWDWPLYRPVIQLAIDYKLPLLAANLSRTDAAKLMREGYAAVLDQGTIQSYRLDQALPAAILNGQRIAMEAGHCGKMPDEIVPSMVRAQVARDVWMAKVVADHASNGVVLLAGNGHVRSDLGVPQWLSASARAQMQSHGYVETEKDSGNKPSAAKQYDITHVIKAHVRPDPCKSINVPAQQKAS